MAWLRCYLKSSFKSMRDWMQEPWIPAHRLTAGIEYGAGLRLDLVERPDQDFVDVDTVWLRDDERDRPRDVLGCESVH